MATIKSHTDLKQSNKLAEILPLESADQIWERIAIVGANLNVPEELQYKHNGDMQFQYYSGIGIPCWSLAALINILPNENILAKTTDGEYYCLTKDIMTKHYNNPIDACYEMILKLHELNLL